MEKLKRDIQKNRSLYINMAIDILSNLNYNEITFIEDRVFAKKLEMCHNVNVETQTL